MASLKQYNTGIYIKYRKATTHDNWTLSQSAAYNDIFEISELSFDEFYEFYVATILDGREIECSPLVLKFNQDVPWMLICMILVTVIIGVVVAFIILYKKRKREQGRKMSTVYYSNTNLYEK